MEQLHVYRAETGEYLGPLRDRYSQGLRADGTPWPDSLIYMHSSGQKAGINADLAEVRDAPPLRPKRHRGG